MSEIKPLARVVIITLILGIIAVLLVWAIHVGGSDGKLSVREYRATLSEDGRLTETYTYDVGLDRQYRMLYRNWEVPLSASSLTVPYIQFIGMTPPPGMVGYVKDNAGAFTLYGDLKDQAGQPGQGGTATRMNSFAELNEAGVFNANGVNLSRGTYTVSYVFQVHPPLEYDSQWTHLNLKLAGTDHVSYENIVVSVPAAYAGRMEVYPPSLKTSQNGDTVAIMGSVAGNENLAVEFLIPNTAAEKLRSVGGTSVRTENLGQKMADGRFWYTLPYTVAAAIKNFCMAAVIAVPFLLIVLYLRIGREKNYTVPAYFSTAPETTIRPWQVNFLFRNNAGKLDRDALFATLLDLQRRKMIAIAEKPDQKSLGIRVLSPASPDSYEQKVLSFLTRYGTDGVFDTARAEALMKGRDRTRIAEARSCGLMLQELISRNPDPSLADRYIVNNSGRFRSILIGWAVVLVAFIAFLVLNPMMGYFMGPALALWIVVLIQVIIANSAPPALFGTWRDDRYREKLEWDSFGRFLSDMAMIRKYSPADLAMWGEWLAYGTALGVGEKVEKAMKDLSIPLATTGVSSYHSGLLLAFTPMVAASARGSGGRGSGGGGFGGGGAGGR